MAPRVDTMPASTMTLRFPALHPEFQTAYYWMERNKIHGKLPETTSNISIWGAFRGDKGAWTSIVAFSDHEAAKTCAARLPGLATTPGDAPKPALHWREVCYYLYLLSLNNAHLRLQSIAEEIDNLRYQNAINPRLGAAHACLMLLNHIECYRRTIDFVYTDVDTFPKNWLVNPLPAWTGHIKKKLCRPLRAVIRETQADAAKTRTLIIEQHSISQSHKVTYLTVLAGAFIPITAVSGFFGMNTVEINGSSWPTKWFGIVAGPLTVVAVFLPLVALSLFSIVLRLYKDGALRLLLIGPVSLVALVISLIVAIRKDNASQQLFLSHMVLSILMACALVSLCASSVNAILNDIKQRKLATRKELWDFATHLRKRRRFWNTVVYSASLGLTLAGLMSLSMWSLWLSVGGLALYVVYEAYLLWDQRAKGKRQVQT